jgi:hypothetical protein
MALPIKCGARAARDRAAAKARRVRING